MRATSAFNCCNSSPKNFSVCSLVVMAMRLQNRIFGGLSETPPYCAANAVPS